VVVPGIHDLDFPSVAAGARRFGDVKLERRQPQRAELATVHPQSGQVAHGAKVKNQSCTHHCGGGTGKVPVKVPLLKV
jgi:hypothetical protein